MPGFKTPFHILNLAPKLLSIGVFGVKQEILHSLVNSLLNLIIILINKTSIASKKADNLEKKHF